MMCTSAGITILIRRTDVYNYTWTHDGFEEVVPGFSSKIWIHDVNLSSENVADLIERRKLYDYHHGSWHFLSCFFMCSMALSIMDG